MNNSQTNSLLRNLLGGVLNTTQFDAMMTGDQEAKAEYLSLVGNDFSLEWLLDDESTAEILLSEGSEAYSILTENSNRLRSLMSNTVFWNNLLTGGVAFVMGGQMSTTLIESSEAYIYTKPGTKGVTPASLQQSKASTAASGNVEKMLVYGGYYNTVPNALSAVEQFSFATPATKGLVAASLSSARGSVGAAGNTERAFVFGGHSWTSANNYYNTVEHYLYANISTKGTAPASLAASGQVGSAAANATNAFVFAVGSSANVETYVFATPGTKGGSAVALSDNALDNASASSNTNAFVFGGQSLTTFQVTQTVANYSFATPGTLGTAPASLTSKRVNSGATSNNTKALVLGGVNNGGYVSTVELYSFATPGTKGTPPVPLSRVNASMASATNRSSF